MSISNFFSRFTWSKQESESVNISLPTEVWVNVWSFVDFDTLQEICTLVSKGWLYEIRNSARLSGEMILRLEDRSAKDINNVLSRWPKLKVLHLSDCECGWKYPSWNKCDCECGSRVSKVMSHWEKSKELPVTIETLGINLTKHELLRKIVVTKSMALAELGDWGKATKVWFDPKIWTPANLENVINLKIFVDQVPRNFEMVQIGQVLKKVEHLYFSGLYTRPIDSELILNLRNFILGFKKLTTVWIEVGVDITDFLDFLRSIANVKNVKFWLNVSIFHDHMEKKYVEGVFEEGFKIVNETFPIESTDVGIGDIEYDDFKIVKKYNEEPELHKDYEFHSESDSDESDSDESDSDEELTENDENSSDEEFDGYYQNFNFVTQRIIQFITFLCRPILWLKNTFRENLNYRPESK
jgi:hypothetical protein